MIRRREQHGVLALSLAASILLCGCATSARSAVATPGASPESVRTASGESVAPLLGKFYPSQGHTHLTPGEPDDFVYSSNPPTSGPHREIFNDAFISPVSLAKYVQVHLLEHGNVLLQYNCICRDVAAALGSIALQYDSKLLPASRLQPTPADVQSAEESGLAVVVAPYPHMKPRIALSAWTRLATLPAVDKARIISFINAYLHNAANVSQ